MQERARSRHVGKLTTPPSQVGRRNSYKPSPSPHTASKTTTAAACPKGWMGPRPWPRRTPNPHAARRRLRPRRHRLLPLNRLDDRHPRPRRRRRRSHPLHPFNLSGSHGRRINRRRRPRLPPSAAPRPSAPSPTAQAPIPKVDMICGPGNLFCHPRQGAWSYGESRHRRPLRPHRNRP